VFITTIADITMPVLAYLFMIAESFPKIFGYSFLILMIIAYYLDCKIHKFKIFYFWTKVIMFFGFFRHCVDGELFFPSIWRTLFRWVYGSISGGY
jgi:hypothetical protein